MQQLAGRPRRGAETAETGLRERKKRETRAGLVDAAQAIVKANGLDALTIEAICARAGVSPRTFFNYFESKVDAVLGIGPWALDAAAVNVFVSGGPTGNLADDVAEFVAAVLSAPDLDLPRMRTAMDLTVGEPRLLARQFGWMEEHRAAMAAVATQRLARFPNPATTDVVTDLMLVLIPSSLRRWEQLGGVGTPADPVRAILGELRSLL
jgi:AcrR family transcriptional regulator